jgi:predicted DNA-binding WGR domain protein
MMKQYVVYNTNQVRLRYLLRVSKKKANLAGPSFSISARGYSCRYTRLDGNGHSESSLSFVIVSMMLEPSASRNKRGLARRGDGHNKVGSERSLLVHSRKSLMMKQYVVDNTNRVPLRYLLRVSMRMENLAEHYFSISARSYSCRQAEATPLHHGSDEFKKQQFYSHRCSPGATRTEEVSGQVDLNENANKFYCLQLLTSTKTSAFAVWTRWGRIGETGQNALKYYDDLNDAKSAFERKFKQKTGLLWDERFAEPKKGKYTLIERPGEGDEKAKPSIPLQERVSPPTTLHPKVQKLVEFIFSKMKKGTTISALNNKFTEECTDVDRQFLALGLAEATPLDHESDEFKNLQHY